MAGAENIEDSWTPAFWDLNKVYYSTCSVQYNQSDEVVDAHVLILQSPPVKNHTVHESNERGGPENRVHNRTNVAAC